MFILIIFLFFFIFIINLIYFLISFHLFRFFHLILYVLIDIVFTIGWIFRQVEIVFFTGKIFRLLGRLGCFINLRYIFLISVYKIYNTCKCVSAYFFIFWYFWLDCTIFVDIGMLVLLISPHNALPSEFYCFYLINLIYIFIKCICFNKFSMY